MTDSPIARAGQPHGEAAADVLLRGLDAPSFRQESASEDGDVLDAARGKKALDHAEAPSVSRVFVCVLRNILYYRSAMFGQTALQERVKEGIACRTSAQILRCFCDFVQQWVLPLRGQLLQ